MVICKFTFVSIEKKDLRFAQKRFRFLKLRMRDHVNCLKNYMKKSLNPFHNNRLTSNIFIGAVFV